MDVVESCEAERDQDPNELTLAALDRTCDSAFRCIVLSSTGDTLAVQVVGDDLPSVYATLLYVEKRGTFKLVRVERWPPASGQKKPRVLLKLAAWPAR